MKNSLELAEVVKSLREELTLAMRGAEGHKLKFKINSIDLELQTAVEKEGTLEGSGKIKFWVLDIDGKVSGKYKKATTHTIKLNLEPITIEEDEQGNETANAVHINDKADINDKT